jgi:PAS domain S-box-containing protein
MGGKLFINNVHKQQDQEIITLISRLKNIDIVNDPLKADYILDLDSDETRVLLKLLSNNISELVELQNSTEELKAILQSSSEGIEAADINGNVKYVNPAFLRIANIKESERLNQNIFSKNPDGLLVRVLKEGKPLHNVTTRAPGSGVEVIASATPIYLNNKMIGAVIVISDISKTIKMVRELENSKSKLASLYDRISNPQYTFDLMIGKTPLFKKTLETAKQFSQSSSTVLIIGESGTGKELFAQAIYNYSNQNGPFIAVNCAAIPKHLIESELFGHEKGAFTGANEKRIGMFELAQNGTIFLDEIGELELSLQAKLLRVLQENEFRRVGGNKVIKNSARIIAATNRPLKKMIDQNQFREDLYYRLNVLELYIPPLRERKQDIPEFVRFFLQKYNHKLGKSIEAISPAAMESLLEYDWPGNIRELENSIERAINLSKDIIVERELFFSLPASTNQKNQTNLSLTTLAEMERKMIQLALDTYGTNLDGKKQAAKALGISLSSLYNKLKVMNLDS